MKDLLIAATLTAGVWLATPASASPFPVSSGIDHVTFPEVTRLVNNDGVFNKRGLAPQVRITSPLDGAFIAPGDSRIGAGDHNGVGFNPRIFCDHVHAVA